MWADRKTQANNTRRTLYVTLRGQQVPFAEALEIIGVLRNKVRKQMAKGLELQEAFEVASLRHLFGLGNYESLIGGH
jgi:hypothetical protein